MVALTGMRSRSGAGNPDQPASIAAVEPAGGLGVVILGEGTEFAPAQRPAEQQGLALQDAPELHAHRQAHNVGTGKEFIEAGQGGGCIQKGVRGEGGHDATVLGSFVVKLCGGVGLGSREGSP